MEPIDSYDPSTPSAPTRPAPLPPAATSPAPRYRRQPVVVRRRILVPLIFFLLTCLSTFWAGSALEPGPLLSDSQQLGSLLPVRQAIVANYRDGLIYMTAVIGILLAHEMGHFVLTLVHRVPSSLPLFLPLPITFIGTMGAVIRMQGGTADRKQIFDIGIGGPIAGLFVAVPVMLLGVQQLKLEHDNGPIGYLQMPLGVIFMLRTMGPAALQNAHEFALGYLQGNPLVLAGWFGFVITGLNMIPISQLDGGHVLYGLFGPRSRWISRALVLGAIIFILVAGAYMWALMVLIILFLGVDHPPTTNDNVKMGVFRYALGVVSLAIPVLCLPIIPFRLAP